MPNNKRARKPRNIFSGGIAAVVMPGPTLHIRTLGLPLRDARRIHNWLGRYIAWAEQGGGKDAEA